MTCCNYLQKSYDMQQNNCKTVYRTVKKVRSSVTLGNCIIFKTFFILSNVDVSIIILHWTEFINWYYNYLCNTSFVVPEMYAYSLCKIDLKILSEIKLLSLLSR